MKHDGKNRRKLHRNSLRMRGLFWAESSSPVTAAATEHGLDKGINIDLCVIWTAGANPGEDVRDDNGNARLQGAA